MIARTSPALRFPKSLHSHNPIPRGCVLYLPLWSPGLSGPVFKSIDSYGHTCTVTGTVWRPDGRLMDGDDLVAVPDADSLDFAATDNFAFGYWLKTTSAATMYIMAKGKNETSSGGNGVYSLPIVAGVPWIYVFDGTWYSAFNNGTTVDDGVWHLVFGVRTQTEIKLYVDGAHTDSTNMTATDMTGTGRLFLGGNWEGTASFVGTIGEAWVYSRALSAGEIAHIHNCTSWRYQ